MNYSLNRPQYGIISFQFDFSVFTFIIFLLGVSLQKNNFTLQNTAVSINLLNFDFFRLWAFWLWGLVNWSLLTNNQLFSLVIGIRRRYVLKWSFVKAFFSEIAFYWRKKLKSEKLTDRENHERKRIRNTGQTLY